MQISIYLLKKRIHDFIFSETIVSFLNRIGRNGFIWYKFADHFSFLHENKFGKVLMPFGFFASMVYFFSSSFTALLKMGV